MALIIVTNPSLTNDVDIYEDKGDRYNRVIKYHIVKNSTYPVDEADMTSLTNLGDTLAVAIKEGQLTITANDLDSLTVLAVKNFLAYGIGAHYFYSHAAFAVNRILTQSMTTGKVGYNVNANTEPLGVSQQSASAADEYKKVYIEPGTSVTVDVSTFDIAVGDYIGWDYDDGKAAPFTTVGAHYIGIAKVAALAGSTITFTINKGVIA